MAVLQECPICNNKQSLKRKKCSCGADLDKFKRSGRIKYHIQYRLPGGKQRKELVGYSIEDAKAADGKRKVQKKEGRIFDMLPQEKPTFKELAAWYLGLPKIKKLASYKVLCINVITSYSIHYTKLYEKKSRTAWVETRLQKISNGNVDAVLNDLKEENAKKTHQRLTRLIGYIERFKASVDYRNNFV